MENPKEKKVKELDWFEMETRMRKVVQDLIAPTVSRVTSDGESIQRLVNQLKAQKQNIDELQTVMLHKQTERKSTIIDEFNAKLLKLDADRREQEAEIRNQISSVKVAIQELNYNIQKQEQKTAQCEQNIENMSKQIIDVKDSVLQHKTQMHNAFKNVTEEFTTTASECRDNAILADEKAMKAESLVKGLQDLIKNFDFIVSQVQNGLNDLKSQVQQLDVKKLDVEPFNDQTEKLQKQIQTLKFEAMEMQTKIGKEFNFIEKMLPIKYQLTLDETLRACLDDRQKKGLVVFHDEKFKKLHTDTLEQNIKEIDERSNEILKGIEILEKLRIEERAAELTEETNISLSKSDVEKVRSHSPSLSEASSQGFHQGRKVRKIARKEKASRKSQVQEEQKEPQPQEEVEKPQSPEQVKPQSEGSILQAFDEYFEQNIMNNLVQNIMHQFDEKITIRLEEEVEKLKIVISGHITEIDNKYLVTLEENKCYMFALHNELDNLNQKTKKELNEIQLEIKKQLQEKHANKLSSFEQDFQEIISALIEILYISQCLDEQDERDRKNIQLIGQKEFTQQPSRMTIHNASPSSLPSITPRNIQVSTSFTSPNMPISLDKNCLSCSGQYPIVIQAFKLACLAYHPSQVGFRNKKYNRNYLLNARGKLLEALQSVVSPTQNVREFLVALESQA